MKRNIFYILLMLFTITTVEAGNKSLSYDTTLVRPAIDTTSIALIHTLDSVVVTAEHITHYADRDVVRITREMRKGARNTAQMLGNIPGIDCDYSNNELRYYGSRNILILVDSIERPVDYIKELHHLRYDKVDIIPNPLGKYAEYDAVINLHTKENYEGYEGNLSNSLDYLPTDGNGSNKRIKDDNTSVAFTYTRNKWNFVGRYNINFHQREIHNEKKNINYVNRLVEDEIDKGLSFNKRLRHNFYTALDYQINKKHSFSASYQISYTSIEQCVDRKVERTWLDTWIKDSIEVNSDEDENLRRQTIGCFYRGKAKDWNYNCDFNYIKEDALYSRDYRQSSGYTFDKDLKSQMDYVWMKTEANRRFLNNQFYLSFGYNYTYKGYKQEDYNNEELLSCNKYNRKELWTWMSFQVNENTSLNFNTSAQHVHTQSRNYIDDNMVYKLGGMLYHRWNDQIWMRINYWNNVSYPSLNLVSEYGYFTDSLTWSGGNPALKTNVNHSGRVWVDFFKLFNVQMGYIYSPNQFATMTDIGEGILPSGEYGQYIVRTPQNTSYQEGWTSFSIFKKVKAFTFSAYLRYRYMKAYYREISQLCRGGDGNIQVRYYNEENRLHLSVRYNLDNSYTVTPEGWGNINAQYLSFTGNKDFLNQQLNVSVRYVTPFLLRNVIKSETSSLAQYGYQYANLRKSSEHALLVTLTYRFHGGKSVRQYNRSMQDER